MTGFELRTSEIGSDHSTNWATTTAPKNALNVWSVLYNEKTKRAEQEEATSCY